MLKLNKKKLLIMAGNLLLLGVASTLSYRIGTRHGAENVISFQGDYYNILGDRITHSFDQLLNCVQEDSACYSNFYHRVRLGKEALTKSVPDIRKVAYVYETLAFDTNAISSDHLAEMIHHNRDQIQNDYLGIPEEGAPSQHP